METRVVVAGWGQVTQRKEHTGALLDPLGLMAEAARQIVAATRQAEALRNIDAVFAVKVMSRDCEPTAERLARLLGATPRLALTSTIGGNSPQALINKAAGMIARGELDSVLIAGGETYYPRAGGPGGIDTGIFKGLENGPKTDDMVGSHPVEQRHGIHLPIHGFPLFETALWAESGLGLKPYLDGVGELWSRFSRVAAANPHSWTQTPRRAAEIVFPGPANRRVAFPYTKYMTALISVDMGAAMLLTSERLAGRLKTGEGRPVYIVAGADCIDRQRFMAEKSGFTASPALEAVVHRALKRGRMSPGGVQCFDLYSCFPCAVTIARRALGLPPDGHRPLTLTGGLGFFGGPGNNYGLHAAACMAEAISRGIHDTGMVTGLGWFMHKHAAGIYSAFPQETSLGTSALRDERDPLVGNAPERVVDPVQGRGTIETYTILHDRDGGPEAAVIYGRTSEGLRFVARGAPEPDIFRDLTGNCRVGAEVRLRSDQRTRINLAELA